MKTKMNLLERLNKRGLPFFFFPIDTGIGNTVVEYLDGAVKNLDIFCIKMALGVFMFFYNLRK